MRTRGSDGAGTSQGGNDIPNPPPAPPSLADAIAVLLSATTDNARLLRELAQRQTHPAPNIRAPRNGDGEARSATSGSCRCLVGELLSYSSSRTPSYLDRV